MKGFVTFLGSSLFALYIQRGSKEKQRRVQQRLRCAKAEAAQSRRCAAAAVPQRSALKPQLSYELVFKTPSTNPCFSSLLFTVLNDSLTVHVLLTIHRLTMDVLPSGSIFHELKVVHDTGYFDGKVSPEERWQQVSKKS